jgi:hypothetical protein
MPGQMNQSVRARVLFACDACLPSGDRNGLLDVKTGVSTSYDSTRSSSLMSEFRRVADIVELLEASWEMVFLAVAYVGVDDDACELSAVS